MADTRLHPILNYLRQVVGTPAGNGVTDAELLRRFVVGRDEAAFELLLWRHAGMVLHVCRQVLRENQAVEDAFQATFLVFVRKAASVSRRESLGGWLYRVAYRTALKAKQRESKRSVTERSQECIEEPAAPADADDADQRDLRRLICEEVDHLPAKYRAPIVACYFEAKTHEEAAHQLGWPQGTIASRLARGRDLLRRRLVRRCVTLTAAAFVAALTAPAAQAALTGLVDSTIQSAKLFAAGAAVPPRLAALAEGVLKAMYWTRVKIVAIVLVVAGVAGAATAFWGTRPRADEPKPDEATAPNAAVDAGKPRDARTMARDMALSRINLRRLAKAMQEYADTSQGRMIPPALVNKDGGPMLSWRVLLLPYLGQRKLYEQFRLFEAWDSPHNKKLLDKMPNVFAPPGVKTPEPYSTFYQVFVSPKPKDNKNSFNTAAFVEGQQQLRFPAHFTDGTSNTILIVEAGKAVPWTSPEDLPFSPDKPLPELGGMFPDIFHAVFADRSVHTLTKKYDDTILRVAVTSNGGEITEFEKILARPSEAILLRKCEEVHGQNMSLRWLLEGARERLRKMKEDRDALRGRPGQDKKPPASRLDELQEENTRLQKELEKLREEMRAVDKEINDSLRKTIPSGDK